MRATTPYVWGATSRDAEAYVDGPETTHVWLDTLAWFAWLDAPTTTHFAYPLFDPRVGYITGVMTVRKEVRARGGVYWTGYRRVEGRLRKAYLGRTATLTHARLAAAALVLKPHARVAASPEKGEQGG